MTGGEKRKFITRETNTTSTVQLVGRWSDQGGILIKGRFHLTAAHLPCEHLLFRDFNKNQYCFSILILHQGVGDIVVSLRSKRLLCSSGAKNYRAIKLVWHWSR